MAQCWVRECAASLLKRPAVSSVDHRHAAAAGDHWAIAGTRGCAGVLQCGCPGSLIPFMQWYAGPKVMCETSNDYNLDKRQLKDSWLLMERRFKSLQISPDCSSRDPLLNFGVSSRHLNNISIFSYFQGKIIPTPIAHASTYRCPNLLSNFVYKFWWVH